MAKSLPETYVISSAHETNQRCEFCLQDGVAEPDDLAAWVSHLDTVHGYKVESDQPAQGRAPRTIRLRLVGWSSRTKFRPNDRVNVNDKAPGDYEGRRGTVVGWHSRTSEYAVRFDEHPIYGFLSSESLERFVRPA